MRGEACCALVLQQQRHGDTGGGATLEGMAVRQDGKSASLTAPNGQAQQQLLRAGLTAAGSTQSELRDIEAHGTGTALGDPIEVGSLRSALRASESGTSARLTLEGVKGNCGHSESAAGLVGLQALLISIEKSFVAPNAQLRVLNPT